MMAVDRVADLHLHTLPLVTLYLSERCNSRCVTCDYWRHGTVDLSIESVQRLLPDFERLGTQTLLLSGGEPLLHPQWESIAGLLKRSGLELWLLTSGLSLVKHAKRIAALFESVTVSLDGTRPATYRSIRGLDAFDNVCEGIRTLSTLGLAPGLRVTLQRDNFRELLGFVRLGKALGAASVSFLAVDVANPHAFGRSDGATRDLALTEDDLPVFAGLLDEMEREFAADFASGFILEQPQKMRRLLQYFTAVRRRGAYPPVRCNVTEFSAVINASGSVQPCFFIAGPDNASVADADLESVLNSADMQTLRSSIRSGGRAECATCVCSLWRESGREF